MAKDAAYLAAEKIIKEALKSGATELDLHNAKISELPEIIGELTSLQSLILRDNQLKALPESIGQLIQLQSLNVSGNKLTSLPQSLGQLRRLRSLNISYNSLPTIPRWLAQFSQLQSLEIDGIKLTALPEWLGQLTQLTELNLSDNQLTALPDSLGQLTQLTELNLSNNQLTTLPDSLGQLTQLTKLNLSDNQLTTLPDSLGQLTQLTELGLSSNQLTALPDSLALAQLTQLTELNLSNNQLTTLPESLGQLTRLEILDLAHNSFNEIPVSVRRLKKLNQLFVFVNKLETIPIWIGELQELQVISICGNNISKLPDSFANLQNLKSLLFGATDPKLGEIVGIPLKVIPIWISNLKNLESLVAENCQLTDIPPSLAQLEHLETLQLDDNPLNPALQSAYEQGLDAVMTYLRAKAAAEITLHEAKLILIGEGEVGKTCLMDALLGKEWQEHPSTHGIEIQQVKIVDPDTQTEITLNGWDFGGQRVYRPTHQLFFSAPAVYLVVWKPREGPQQGFVKEWIQLIKRREPTAKIIIVATHGGPQMRQPDIDRQELWDLFGKDTVVDFFFVESKPNEKTDKRRGIEELKQTVARVAAGLPEMGQSVPKSFQDVRQALQAQNVPYLPLEDVLALCREHKMDDEIAQLFIRISHRLGHLTHYENDPTLRDIVILRPDWLATAMSYVLDDEETRKAHGLVQFSRLCQLWNDPSRPRETRYDGKLHRVFLRLMERFDLSYRVAGLSQDDETNPVSLIAQLVPDNNPEKELAQAWPIEIASGDIQQTQICRIVDAQNSQSANAEGLFYQLIVRLHKFSLGRLNYHNSIHWQRGLVLDGDYNGRALLRHIGNDVHITVRAPYPEFFLAMLTREVKYLVESFWEGLRCDVMVSCLNSQPCAGLFEVGKLIENKKRGRPEQPCPVCNEWQNIDSLLLNAPAARPVPTSEALANRTVLDELSGLRKILITQSDKVMGRFDSLDASQRELLSKAEASFNGLMRAFTDEAKEGPRLFSMRPADPKWHERPKQLVSQKFRILLWCEHSQLPLFVLNKEGDNHGIYEMDLPYEWVIKAAPYLKALTATLSLILPMASSTTKLVMDEAQYKDIEKQLAFGKDVFDSVLKGSDKVVDWVNKSDAPDLPHGAMQRAEGALLREFQAFLKEKDPGFGGLVRVMNKRQEFLWVHKRFAGEY